MLYEYKLHCFFDDPNHLTPLINAVETRKQFMVVVNPGTPEQECCTEEVIENNHDVNPNEPCQVVSAWDNSPP